MPEVSVLNVYLHERPVATLTLVQGDRTIFAFNQDYIDDPDRKTLSLAFKDPLGGLKTDHPPTQRVLSPFFSNLLPEGPLRKYLAERARVNPQREFFLLWMLGNDLPGAVSVHPADGEELPPGFDDAFDEDQRRNALRFSLAGIQLKFSALGNSNKVGGLTIPAKGVGGSWIVKLPSQQFPGLPENEFSMMTIAGMIGMDVPELLLLSLDEVEGLPDGIGEFKGQALAVKRFDRSPEGSIHIEDFAQVFGIWPDEKYEKRNYRNIATVLSIETSDAEVGEYIRRLVFSTLIGNADMHMKNWSLIYRDGRAPSLSPAYDLLSTIPYLPTEEAALKYSRTKRMSEVSKDELSHLAAKAKISEKLVLDVAAETVVRFRETWELEKKHLPLDRKVVDVVTDHLSKVPLAREF